MKDDSWLGSNVVGRTRYEQEDNVVRKDTCLQTINGQYKYHLFIKSINLCLSVSLSFRIVTHIFLD